MSSVSTDSSAACPAATAGLSSNAVAVRDLRDADAFDHSLCRRLSRDAGLPREHGRWPRPADPDSAMHQGDTLVAAMDGRVVGRAVLEAPYPPYAEVVNLCVRPDYRRRGAATEIVRECLRRARTMGCQYPMVQEYREQAQAHNVYVQQGFLPATLGEFRRLVNLLDVPVVSLFRLARSAAAHRSHAAPERGERWWELAWEEGADRVALFLHGGSCQFDSDGFQPVVQACELRTGEFGFTASLEAPTRVKRGDTLDLALVLESTGPAGLNGVVRAMLLPDTDVPGEAGLAAREVTLAEGEAVTVAVPVKVRHEFATDGQRFVSYPSAPFTLELAWEGGSVLLSAAVIVE